MKKTVLITGAGSGIGKDTAFALARRGHVVIATTETEEQASNLKKEIDLYGIKMQVFKLDILNPDDRQKTKEYEIDVLINNAGIGESGSLAEIDINKIRHNFEVNVFSSLLLTQLVLNKMLIKKKGTIVFISSLASKIAMPFLAPYCMSKAALSSAATALRDEVHRLEKNVHVSIIEPGAYHTGFNQRNIGKKYIWMKKDSLFYALIPQIKKREERQFKFVELKSTRSIVIQIIKAAEAKHPSLYYRAPWWQALGVHILRLFKM